MMRLVLLATFAAGILCAQDDELPAGKGKEILQRMCSVCHGIQQVTDIRQPKKLWANLVDDMVSRGATGSDDEINAVVSYLARNFGQPVDVNAATNKDLIDGLSFTPAEAAAIIKYRTDNGKFKSLEDLSKVPGVRPEVLDEQKKNFRF